MRKLCRDRLYFDLRDSSNRQTGIGGVITSHSSRFDLRVVLPTQAQAKAEMDASGVRGITLFDAPPDMQEDSLHSGSEHSKGTWLGILRAKGRREREIVESDDPNLISFRMRSGPHGNHRDSFETHPPVEAGGGDCSAHGSPGVACIDFIIGSHPEIFDGHAHNISWTIRPRKGPMSQQDLKIAVYVDGVLHATHSV